MAHHPLACTTPPHAWIVHSSGVGGTGTPDSRRAAEVGGHRRSFDAPMASTTRFSEHTQPSKTRSRLSVIAGVPPRRRERTAWSVRAVNFYRLSAGARHVEIGSAFFTRKRQQWHWPRLLGWGGSEGTDCAVGGSCHRPDINGRSTGSRVLQASKPVSSPSWHPPSTLRIEGTRRARPAGSAGSRTMVNVLARVVDRRRWSIGARTV